MKISFQLLLYIIEVKYQEDQKFCSLNFSDIMGKTAIVLLKYRMLVARILCQVEPHLTRAVVILATKFGKICYPYLEIEYISS